MGYNSQFLKCSQDAKFFIELLLHHTSYFIFTSQYTVHKAETRFVLNWGEIFHFRSTLVTAVLLHYRVVVGNVPGKEQRMPGVYGKSMYSHEGHLYRKIITNFS